MGETRQKGYYCRGIKANLSRRFLYSALDELSSFGGRVLSKQKGIMRVPSSKIYTTVRGLGVQIDPAQSFTVKTLNSLERELQKVATFPEARQALRVIRSVRETLNQASISFSEIIAVTKSDKTVGNITVTSNSAAVTNVVLGPLETTVKFRQIRLYPTPAGVLTITVKHFAPPPILTHIYDDTQIPQTWDYVVDQFAFALALQAKGQDQASEFTTQYALAKQFLDEDMATEERAVVHVPLIARRAGDTGDLTPTWLPSGHGFLG